MEDFNKAQVTKIMIALIGMNDPETKEHGPTAPILVYRETKPQIVYLIPTTDPERPCSYPNAQETKRWLEKEGCGQVKVVPVTYTAVFNKPNELLLPEMENILRTSDRETRDAPNRRFVICPVSGLPRMRDMLKTLLERKVVQNFEVYDVDLGPPSKVIPIWSEIHEPRVGLFVDADALGGVPSKNVRAMKEAAAQLGSVEEAWAFANWFGQSKKSVKVYYENGFRPVALPVAPEIADVNLFTFIGESLEYKDNDTYVIVSHDTRFHNGIAAILGHGKEVHFWNPQNKTFGVLRTLQQLHPERLHLRYLADVLSKQAERQQVRKTEVQKPYTKPVKHAIITSPTPQGVLSTLCVIRLEQLSLKDITMYFNLDSLSGQFLPELSRIYIVALSDNMATPAAWFRFLDKIRKTKGLAIRVINLSEAVDRNLPRSDPTWHLWSEPRLSSYGDLLSKHYASKVNGDTIARLCVDALSAKPGPQGGELLEKAKAAVREGPQQIMKFLRSIAATQ